MSSQAIEYFGGYETKADEVCELADDHIVVIPLVIFVSRMNMSKSDWRFRTPIFLVKRARTQMRTTVDKKAHATKAHAAPRYFQPLLSSPSGDG